MPDLKFDCGATCRVNGMGDFKRMCDVHMRGCRECNPKIRDLGTVECGCLYMIDGHMCKCVETESVCNPHPPFSDEVRTYRFEVLPKKG